MILDHFLGEFRWYRRLRGERWICVVHIWSLDYTWLRRDYPDNSAWHVFDAEDYRLPRARLLP